MPLTNSQVYSILKDKVDTLSVQICPTFANWKQVKIGGRYCGFSQYNTTLTTDKLYEVLLNDGLSNYYVITFANEFEQALKDLNISVGDVIVSDGIMSDALDGSKLIMIYSIQKEA